MSIFRPKLQWYQFSLGGLLVFITLCALLMGFFKTIDAETLSCFVGFLCSCVLLFFVVLVMLGMDCLFAKIHFSISLIITPILYFVLSVVFYVFGCAIDQPHPAYIQKSWLDYAFRDGLSWGGLFGIVFVVLESLDIAVQQAYRRLKNIDIFYYPRLFNLWTSMKSAPNRVIILIGFSLLFYYYSTIAIELYEIQQRPGGLVWPPLRVFSTCMFGWGILWSTDCLSRPHYGTLLAAICFLLFTFLFLTPYMFTIIRE